MISAAELECLRNLHFLRNLDESDLNRLQETLRPEAYAAGDLILRKGDPVKSLYIISSGSVEWLPSIPQANRLLHAGDIFGEVELICQCPFVASARAAKNCTLLVWDRDSLFEFLQSHPKSLESFQLVAKSRRLASQLRLPWLRQDEIVFGLARKHFIALVKAMIIPGLLLLIAAWMLFRATTTSQSLSAWLAGGSFITGLLLAIWNWFDWRNDFYVVTNRRVVWTEKIIGIYEGRQEALMHMVLSVSVNTGALGRLLGFGDVIVRTYTGQVIFREASTPQILASLVEYNWKTARIWQRFRDQEGRRDIIRNMLAPESKPEGESPSPEGGPSRGGRADWPGIGHWTFEVRFEHDGVITYRKHWAVLLRRLGGPTFASLALAAWFISAISGLIPITLPPEYYLIGGGLLIVTGLWWLYGYVDWANDLYQVTPEQIVDIHRKPLASEVRKAAPLENILGTEVDRRGLIGLLLNYGSVITHIGTERFVFDGVFDPAGVQEDIIRAMEARLALKEEQDKRQRRDEMVEWLRVYHRETGHSPPNSRDGSAR